MDVLHLTPEGSGSGVTRPERRVAWALVRETIRHELAERHATHWPRYRPSGRRRLAAYLAARRRGLVVVTDHGGADRRVLAAATFRTSSARFGRLAAAPHRVLRHCTKGTVILATMLVLLAVRDGRVSIGALFGTAVFTAILTAPAFSVARERLGDRVLANRAAMLARAQSGETGMLVLHDLGFPQPAAQQSPRVDSTELVAQALRARDGMQRIAQPCCIELAARYAQAAGVEWLPQHVRVDRTLLVFSPYETTSRGARQPSLTVVSSLDAHRESLQPV